MYLLPDKPAGASKDRAKDRLNYDECGEYSPDRPTDCGFGSLFAKPRRERGRTSLQRFLRPRSHI